MAMICWFISTTHNTSTLLLFAVISLFLLSSLSSAKQIRGDIIQKKFQDNNNHHRRIDNDDGIAIGIAGYRNDYTNEELTIPSSSKRKRDKSNKKTTDFCWDQFDFGRFQSPQAVQDVLSRQIRGRHALRNFKGKDGRHGLVSSTRLGGDWVLAESQQTAIDCTCHDVLRAYLSSKLQKKWNPTQVMDCSITKRKKDNDNKESYYYQQDLILHSQRVIRSHTGIMKYSQRITIDQIGIDGQGKEKYCVSVALDPSAKTTTTKKPFEKLAVYVNLQQNGSNVDIYAAGIMKVNRSVVPNLIVFDASGIAGSLAGKGTLWLTAHFDEILKGKTKKTAAVTAEKVISSCRNTRVNEALLQSCTSASVYQRYIDTTYRSNKFTLPLFLKHKFC